METAEHLLRTLTGVEHHVRLLTAATRADEIVSAATNYLASWSRERIENLQKIDGGWGTFDQQQRPEPIHGIADIARISTALNRHCLALKDAGIAATPELLELDLYFALAKQVVEAFMAARSNNREAGPHGQAYRHWSDRDAMAA